MTAKTEQKFLAAERKNANAFFGELFMTHLRKEQAELTAAVRVPANAQVGRQFPGDAGGLVQLLFAEGIRDLFEGRVSGFQRLREAQAFEYWQALVFEAAFERDTTPDRFRRGFSVTSVGSCLLALHLGSVRTAQAIALRIAAETHDPACNRFLASTGAVTFQARLIELIAQQPLNLDWTKLPPLGRYEDLLDPTRDGERYLADLEWGCQEHLNQSRESKRVVFPFAFAVFAPLPIELVMWLVWRRKLGLEHGTHGHPLLESPLASLDPAPSSEPPSELMGLLEQGIPHMQAYLAG